MPDVNDRLEGARSNFGCKKPVRVAASSNIATTGLQTIDGIALAEGDRVLRYGQTDAAENGVFAASTGEWPRTKDFDGTSDWCRGTLIPVASGTANEGKLFRVTSADPTDVGESDITFADALLDSSSIIDAGLYGLVSDATRVAVTALITSGTAALIATGASFTSADVGKIIAVPGAGAAGVVLVTTIAGFTSSTQITLGSNASTTLSAVSATIAYGTDNAAALQSALDAVPATGGTLSIPPGDYAVGSAVTRTLNATGVLGWGVEIVGGGASNTVIYPIRAASAYAMEILGPSGTFSSGFAIKGIQFRSGVNQSCHGLKLTGAVNAKVQCFFNQCNIGLDVEAVLVSTFDCDWYQNTVGLAQRASGFFGGAWGASGCNANTIRGDFRENLQYGLISATFQGIDIQAHFERNGDENIAGGGIADNDRGGMRFTDPEGRMRLDCSFEDNGDLEDATEGKGCVYVLTTASNAGINWSLVLNGCHFQRTADGPKSIVYVDQNSSAGEGHIIWQGSILQNLPSYTPSAANPPFNLTAAGQNLTLSMFGGDLEGAATEFALSNDVKYNIYGLPNCTPSQRSQAFIRSIGSGTAFMTLQTTASANLDVLGSIAFAGRDSAGNVQEYARLRAYISDNTSGSEDGVFQVLAFINGAITEVAAFGPGILSAQPLGGIGYSAGAGGAVTQATNKTTGVTLNKACGQITLNAASLAAATIVSFTLTNGAIVAGDTLVLNHISGGTGGAYTLNAQSANGSAVINIRNNTAGALAEAIVITFAVVRAVAA